MGIRTGGRPGAAGKRTRLAGLLLSAILSAAWLALAAPAAASAAEADARLRVDLPADEAGAPTDVRALVARALPALWDRIVPAQARARANAIAPDTRLLLRLAPGREATTLEFNREAVFRALKDAGIPFIPAPPRIRLVIHARNLGGMDMRQTETLLMEQARRIADERGIILADNAPGLVLEWRWITDRDVMLNARGATRLPEFSETRTLQGADPLPEMTRWLEETLLKARDAHAFAAEPATDGTAAATATGQRVTLTIRRDAPLAAQVALEETLAHDPRVARLVPLELSRSRQRYALWINGGDGWLPDWFARRGFRLTPLPGNEWLAE